MQSILSLFLQSMSSSQTPARPRRTLRSNQNSQLENLAPSDAAANGLTNARLQAVATAHKVRTPVRTRSKKEAAISAMTSRNEGKRSDANASDEELVRIAEAVEKEQVGCNRYCLTQK